MDKSEIRKIYLDKRNNTDEEKRIADSITIASYLFSHPSFQKAKNIGFYVSKDSEVETILFIEQALKNNKRISVPKVEGNIINFYRIRNLSELKEGSFHVFEPTTSFLVQPQKLDLIIVPMLAYNQKKYRVGYGKAYYDKYLSQYTGKTIGLAFSFQETKEDFQEEFDLPLDYIINEKGVIK